MHVAEALPPASQIDCAITLRITTQLSFAEPAPYHHIVQRAAPTSAYTVFTPPIQSMLRLTNERNIDETTGFLPRVTICANGSFCGDGFPNCCEKGEGVFLESTGDTVSRLQTAVASSTPTLFSTSSSQPGLSNSPPSPTIQTGTTTIVKTSISSPASTTTSATLPSCHLQAFLQE